jgi:bacillopeptidase F (M6 metalloprotease family)
MGLFDKIKSMANQITGGGAKVSLIVEGTSVKSTVKLLITAVIKDADLTIGKVYASAQCIEKINIPRQNLTGGAEKNPADVLVSTNIFQNMEFTVSPAQTLEGGKTYNWTHELTLPANAAASYAGKHAKVEWQFFAGLDAKGNDPDSGWVTHLLQ